LMPVGIDGLRCDKDGDGNFETPIEPTTIASGTDAQDTTPPSVNLSFTAQSNLRLITISAQDSGTGVKAIYYAAGDSTFAEYKGPFTVDPSVNSSIYVFADDNVGNRSGVVEFQLSAPVILVEQGTNRAVALDSVTWLRAPFRVVNDRNFSADHHTRVILFTSNLGLSQPDPSVLTVQAGGTTLTVESVGVVTGVTGMDASYIVARLPDGLPTGDLPLTVTLRGVASVNSPILSISQ
jgi:hypothetical protein